MTPEDFIKKCTKRSSNMQTLNSYGVSICKPWVSSEEALEAVEMAREEIYEWLEKNIYMYNGECEGDRKEIINDLKQAIKDE